MILGRDPRDIDGIWRTLHFEGAMRTTGGADMRVLRAVNMAQLDILGQASGLPLYRLLGGKTRDRVRVYNTTTDYWAVNGMKMGSGHDEDPCASSNVRTDWAFPRYW